MARAFVVPAHPAIAIADKQAVVGLMVRAARTKQALRIDDAAALCDVSVALLSALENGNDRSVGFDKVLQILDHLGLAMLITEKSKVREIVRTHNEP